MTSQQCPQCLPTGSRITVLAVLWLKVHPRKGKDVLNRPKTFLKEIRRSSWVRGVFHLILFCAAAMGLLLVWQRHDSGISILSSIRTKTHLETEEGREGRQTGKSFYPSLSSWCSPTPDRLGTDILHAVFESLVLCHCIIATEFWVLIFLQTGC